MAWSTDFVNALASSEVWLRFALVRGALWDEYTPSPDPFAVLSDPADPMLLAAYPGALSTVWLNVEDGATLAVSSQALDMRACRGGGSGLSAQVCGAPGQLRLTMIQIPVGSSVQLVAFASSDRGATWWQEVVYHGRVQSLRRVGPRLDVDVMGIEGALGRRPNSTLSKAGPILQDVGGTPTGTLSNSYTAGDTHLRLSTAAPWAIVAPTKGVAVVEHAGEFAVTYTGTATGPYRVTGCPTVSTVSSSASALGGADVINAAGRPVSTYKERIAADPPLTNAPSNTVVRFPAYYSGHPLEAALRCITSRGTMGPANGAYDVLPWQWGLGIDEGYLDAADIAVDVLVTAGALLERLEELRDRADGVDGATFLDELLAQAGFFMAQRQGRLTLRAVPNPYGASASPVAIGGDDLCYAVGADALAGGEGLPVEHDPWPAAFPAFRQLLYVSNALAYHTRTYAFTASIPTTLCDGAAALVLTDRWGPHGASDTAVVEAGDRLAPSQMAVPEVYTVSLRGLHWARLTKGDFVSLTLPGEISRQGTGLVVDYLGVVLSVDVDWLTGIVKVAVACFNPNHDPEDPDVVLLSEAFSGGN